MTAAENALTVVISTRRLDDDSQVYAKVVVVPAINQARVLDSHFADSTHARVLIRAVRALVQFSGQSRYRLRVVIPDRVVVGLLNGDPGGANGIGRRVVAIHQKGKDVSADCTYEYGTVATMLGQAADQLDVW